MLRALRMVPIAGLVLVSARCERGGSRGRAGDFSLGTPATAEDIRLADDDVTPTGHGLPHDSGTVAEGDVVYHAKCAVCHGQNGVEGPMDKLVGRMPGDSFPFGRDPAQLSQRTIGNYWPYATTVYDFIHRAMPHDRPGSLTSHEVYAVTAYILYRNGIIARNAVMNERTLPAVRMPAHDRFVIDDRNGGNVVR